MANSDFSVNKNKMVQSAMEARQKAIKANRSERDDMLNGVIDSIKIPASEVKNSELKIPTMKDVNDSFDDIAKNLSALQARDMEIRTQSKDKNVLDNLGFDDDDTV